MGLGHWIGHDWWCRRSVQHVLLMIRIRSPFSYYGSCKFPRLYLAMSDGSRPVQVHLARSSSIKYLVCLHKLGNINASVILCKPSVMESFFQYHRICQAVREELAEIKEKCACPDYTIGSRHSSRYVIYWAEVPLAFFLILYYYSLAASLILTRPRRTKNSRRCPL